MAAAEALDLRLRAGTAAEATPLLPDPAGNTARVRDPVADAMALASGQARPSGAAVLQREGAAAVSLMHSLDSLCDVPNVW